MLTDFLMRWPCPLIEELSHDPHVRVNKLPAEREGEKESLIRQRFETAQFYEYTNRVGNWKTAYLTEINGRQFIYQTRHPEDRMAYEEKHMKESRPPIFAILPYPYQPDKEVILTPFMGSTILNYSDPLHLALLASIEITFAFNPTPSLLDKNEGNLRIYNHQLWYVDKTLVYVKGTTREVIHKHVSETLQRIKKATHPDFYREAGLFYLQQVDSLL